MLSAYQLMQLLVLICGVYHTKNKCVMSIQIGWQIIRCVLYILLLLEIYIPDQIYATFKNVIWFTSQTFFFVILQIGCIALTICLQIGG